MDATFNISQGTNSPTFGILSSDTESRSDDMVPEQLLWITVLEKAFDDALLPSLVPCKKNPLGQRVSRHKLHIDSAIDFLTTNTSHFRTVCGLAGLDSDWVMSKYRQIVHGEFSTTDVERLRNKMKKPALKRIKPLLVLSE